MTAGSQPTAMIGPQLASLMAWTIELIAMNVATSPVTT